MSEDDELVTSHSDENPELGGRRGGGGPLAAHSTEGSPIDDLYKKDRQQHRLGVRDDEHVIEYDEYISEQD